MINIEDQETLFKVISQKLKKDLICYAFGGNAMMYYGYKNATKDVDILFETEDERREFVRVLVEIGYKKIGLSDIYSDLQVKDPHKPEMYMLKDERFDLFMGKIFRMYISKSMKERVWGKYEYRLSEKSLTVYVLAKEDIILLKSITNRERDFDDILLIIDKEKGIDWDAIIDEAIEQYKLGNEWVVLDMEEFLQKLKKQVYIKEEYFDRLYSVFAKKKKS